MARQLKIFVAMSGGVDSSLTAALLKKQGHDVVGVFMKGWYPPDVVCRWKEDRRDAMRVAAILDIPFLTFDFEKGYKKFVIDYMINEYKKGRTPNPDIMCNKHIKFDLFLKRALKMGADKIATGHYVCLRQTGFQISNKSELNYKLTTSKDKNKDQSYFLWTLTQKQLKYCLFPIGNYLKTDVRKMAEEFKLPVFDKKDSYGLCFIGDFSAQGGSALGGKMEDFLKKYIKVQPGKIVDEKGKMLGKHEGVQYYTIGQRRGINLTGRQPYYVIDKNVHKNLLIVSVDKKANSDKKTIMLSGVNWISGKKPDFKKTYQARVRYRQPLQKCKLFFKKGNILVSFDNKKEMAVAEGQSLVIYKDKEMLGGGVLEMI